MILVMEMDTKRCLKCGIRKPRSEFGKVSKAWDGLNTQCKSCRAALQRARREENLEADRQRKREYRAANPDKISAYNKHYRLLDPEAHRERVREYKRLNPEKRAEWDNKRRLIKQGLSYFPISDNLLKMKLHYYGGKCWICRTADHEHWDHVKPLSKGGAHILANLRPSCESCNLSKHDKWPFTRPN